MSSAQGILIVVEPRDGRVPGAALELVTLARQLAAEGAGPVCAALIGEGVSAHVQALGACGVERIFLAELAGLAEQPVEARLVAVEGICREASVRIVLLAHDTTGTELAPRLAFRLDGAVSTGCVEARYADGTVTFTRPCYGGIAREVAAFEVAPAVATVRAGVCAPAEPCAASNPEIVSVSVALDGAVKTRLAGREVEKPDGIPLEDARVIVAGGRGLEGPEGFPVLEELARALGGTVGASRVPCDLGWCPHSWQIGLTGKTVTPELYIAVGISGAGHHMAGCGNAKTIVAINTDPQAAIFQDARYGVIGDYRAIVPALTAEVRKLKERA